MLALMVTSAAIGGTLQYGYNLAIMNAPTIVRSASPPSCACVSVSSVSETQFFSIIVWAHRLMCDHSLTLLAVHSEVCKWDIPGALGCPVAGLPSDTGLDLHCVNILSGRFGRSSHRWTYGHTLWKVMKGIKESNQCHLQVVLNNLLWLVYKQVVEMAKH